MSCRQPYNPKRLLHPLKRAGERGEGKWEEISWDQALDEIAAKLCNCATITAPSRLPCGTWWRRCRPRRDSLLC